jgi:hypothetical protein
MRSDRAKVWRLAASALVLAGVQLAQAPNVPQTNISNGVVKATIYLPDAARGYYRGVRFDWSGIVASLTFQGHEFFGQWFAQYDPFLNDAIMGPVEEFRGDQGGEEFNAAKPGGLFVKIGVGVLRRPDAKPYSFGRTYELVNPGQRMVRPAADHIDFVHELNNGEGFAYQYTKTLRLPRSKAQLVIEHALKNTGTRVIDTDVYNHDFYMLDHLPTGPDARVKFLFTPRAKDTLTAPALIAGNEIHYQRELAAENESAAGAIEGFSASVNDNDIRVENTKAGIGVRETGDQPIARLYFWSTKTTVCPEVYVHVHADPGKTFKWRTSYEFYLLNPHK